MNAPFTPLFVNLTLEIPVQDRHKVPDSASYLVIDLRPLFDPDVLVHEQFELRGPLEIVVRTQRALGG